MPCPVLYLTESKVGSKHKLKGMYHNHAIDFQNAGALEVHQVLKRVEKLFYIAVIRNGVHKRFHRSGAEL